MSLLGHHTPADVIEVRSEFTRRNFSTFSRDNLLVSPSAITCEIVNCMHY